MTTTAVPIRHDDRFFIGGKWVEPSSSDVIEVIESATEQPYFSVPEAREAGHGPGGRRGAPSL